MVHARRGLALLAVTGCLLATLVMPAQAKWNEGKAQPSGGGCPNLSVRLKASNNRRGRASATLTITSTGQSPVTNMMVSIQLPEHFSPPSSASIKPTLDPQPASMYSAPSQIWSNVTILQPGKQLRFKIEGTRDACQADATTATFNAQAYLMSGSTITCISRASPAAVKVKNGRKPAAPCPPPPAVALFAADQTFFGMTEPQPVRRLLEEEEGGTARGSDRILASTSPEDCIAQCGAAGLTPPFYASHFASTGGCRCCQDGVSCGPLVYEPGANTYRITSE
jgi:hypothetical protein